MARTRKNIGKIYEKILLAIGALILVYLLGIFGLALILPLAIYKIMKSSLILHLTS